LAKESKVKLLDSSAKINELNQNDPHIWLDPLLGIKQVEQITEAFCKLDAKHADYYNKNSAALIQKLLKLDQDFKEAFSFKHKPFVVAHAAFGYLATRYHLEQLAVYGLTTTHEASLKELLHLKKRMQQDQIRYLFFDGTARPKVAEELRCEMGATALELSSLEKLTVKERAQGDDYFKIMYRNLRRLKQAVKD
jgi:zinc transport system substrate-binding protein